MVCRCWYFGLYRLLLAGGGTQRILVIQGHLLSFIARFRVSKAEDLGFRVLGNNRGLGFRV